VIYKPKAKTITMKHIKLYEEFVNEAAEPKFVVHKGAAVMGYASSKVQARQNAKAQGAEYSTIEDYKEQYGDKFITEGRAQWTDKMNDAQRDVYNRIVAEIDASAPYKRDRIYNHNLLGLALDTDKGFKKLSKAEQSYVEKALSGVLNFQLMNER